MVAQVKQWGNSQGVRIPKSALEEAGILMEDTLNIETGKGYITLSKPFRHRTLEERIAEYGGAFSVEGEYDWGTPVGREVW